MELTEALKVIKNQCLSVESCDECPMYVEYPCGEDCMIQHEFPYDWTIVEDDLNQ